MADGITTLLKHNESTGVTWDSSADCHAVSYYVHVAVGVFLSAVAIFAIVGNLLVLYTYFRHASLRTSSNLLIINLTVADCLMSSINFPVFAASSLNGCWMLGYVGCQIYGSTSSIFSLVTINTFAAISFDRYICIAHRLARMHRMAKSTIGCLIAVIWLLSIIWSILPLMGFGSYRLEGMGTSCTFNYVDHSLSQMWFFICLVTFNFFLPLMVIIYSYLRIYMAVRKVKQELKCLQRPCRDTTTLHMMETNTEIKLAITSIVIIVIFCTAWTPYVIISFFSLFGPKNKITPLTSMVPNILAKVSTVSNPILYTFGHSDVRKKMRTLLCSRYQQDWHPALNMTVNICYCHFHSHKTCSVSTSL